MIDMNIKLFISRLFFLMGAAAYLSACGKNDTGVGSDILRLLPDNQQVTLQGKTIYADTCASCHGTNLEGQENWKVRSPQGLLPAPPHDESGHTWHHTDQVLFDITKFGVQKFAGADYQSAMPAYTDTLTDAEIIAVLSYIKSQWPENIRKRHDALNAQQKAIAVQNKK
jgi:mono/diheme cytochrome c family protein